MTPWYRIQYRQGMTTTTILRYPNTTSYVADMGDGSTVIILVRRYPHA